MARVFSTLCLLVLFSQIGVAQTFSNSVKAEMALLDSMCKACIDEGGTPLSECEKVRHRKLDTLLNNVCRELRVTLDSASFRKLQKEEPAWLKKRDAKQEAAQSRIGRSSAGVDADEAVAIRSDSYFVEQRIRELLRELK
ncbi:MAG: DUF1311 domain-containing protein [Chitinophagaceae bacterium]|nr:DUF1311 domain-containing protein [Chitinophagaceae bacterium]